MPIPMQQVLLSLGAKKKSTYIDDVFSTHLYKGNSTSRSINNGIDLAGEGGLVWFKERDGLSYNNLFDTVRGTGKTLYSNETNAQYDSGSQLTAFNNNGFSIDTTNYLNSSSKTYSSWTFRKQKGFFDVVTWTGNGASNRQISHSLGSIPGMVIVKRTNTAKNWYVYHRGTHSTNSGDWYLTLNMNETAYDNDAVFGGMPTADHFIVQGNDETNANGDEYVAYVFAGGESTAATARSVDFDGTGDWLTTSTSSDYDLGTGDFTLECWIKWDATASNLIFLDHRASGDSNQFVLYVDNDAIIFNSISGDRITTGAIANNQWYHVALVRHSATSTMYVNGVSQGTYADTKDYDNDVMVIGAAYGNNYEFDGKISNVRLVKGTAVYTSSFRPPTEPLTNITNTKLLCCNDSSVTGSTVTPGTITANGDPTASTDSPFDDPGGFKFGEGGDQNIIKCGSYVGSGSAGLEVNIGFEPQWLMIKRASGAEDWMMYDSMRGMAVGGDEKHLKANTNAAEGGTDWFDITSTGFKLVETGDQVNGNGDNYIYMAIRRPDGYVGKPPELGTGVFAMDTGAGSSTIPNFDSNFPVDFAFFRNPSVTDDWITGTRLMGAKELKLQSTGGQNGSADNTWDSNTGWNEWSNADSDYQSWMWKRHAGFDVVTYKGNGTAGHTIPHSLNAVPEMMWLKCRGQAETWIVYHKDLNGGTNPHTYYMSLNSNSGESNWDWTNGTPPTSTHFTLGTGASINFALEYICMLFSSVDGISKVGSFDGSSSSQTITTGFQPRFLIVKKTSEAGNWYMVDTVRGWVSGTDKQIKLDLNQPEYDGTMGAPTSTGFTITSNNNWNGSGQKYIYYAHA